MRYNYAHLIKILSNHTNVQPFSNSLYMLVKWYVSYSCFTLYNYKGHNNNYTMVKVCDSIILIKNVCKLLGVLRTS